MSESFAAQVPKNEECNQEDFEAYGELYWHRSHQISGIHCCLKHFSPLFESSVKTIGSNKHRFQIPTVENCSNEKNVLDGVAEKTRTEYINHCKRIAFSIFQLLNHPVEHRPLNWFDWKYKNRLAEMNLAYHTGRVKQADWRDYFLSKYSNDVLQLFQSSLRGEQDWLSLIVQKNRKSFHPIRHLLVMSVLEMSVEEVFNNEFSQPFGQPKYPCQNTVCKYFNVKIIEGVSISLCEKTKKPIGTFLCPMCKFSYTRKGPDQSEADKYRRTRVKSYGSLWEMKLQEYSKLGLGLRGLSRRMGADPNTVKRFLNNNKQGNLKYYQQIGSLEEDRNNWMSLQKMYPIMSIKQLRETNKAIYMRLYRNDREG